VTVRPVYCIDTSSFLEGWGTRHSPAVLPLFESRIGSLILEGRAKICEEVRAELQKQTDAYSWIKEQEGFIDLFDEEQEAIVVRILQEFSTLVDVLTNKSGGDPFVIALAYCRGYTVVTEERQGSSDHPKIPYVCKRYGVNCIKLVELMDNEGWL
jgi:hypothetical protein